MLKVLRIVRTDYYEQGETTRTRRRVARLVRDAPRSPFRLRGNPFRESHTRRRDRARRAASRMSRENRSIYESFRVRAESVALWHEPCYRECRVVNTCLCATIRLRDPSAKGRAPAGFSFIILPPGATPTRDACCKRAGAGFAGRRTLAAGVSGMDARVNHTNADLLYRARCVIVFGDGRSQNTGRGRRSNAATVIAPHLIKELTNTRC